MLRSAAFLALLLVGGLVLAGRPAAAEDNKPADAAGPGLLEDLVTAHRLAEFGRRQKAPEALLAAGSLLLQVNNRLRRKMDAIAEKPLDEKGEEVRAEPRKTPGLSEEAEALFDEARILVAGDARSSAAVEALLKASKRRGHEASREVLPGPRRIERGLNPGQSHTYRIGYIRGLPAAVALTTGGDSPLHLRITDAEDKEVLDVRGANSHYTWQIPPGGKATQTYSIWIKNTGTKGVIYRLLLDTQW
jgi:hypothetical protein